MKRALLTLPVAASLALSLAACGGQPPPPSASVASGGSKDPSNWPKDDRSLCDWKNKPELDHVETVGQGAVRPNVRRVYKTFGEAESRRRVLVCREIDTNLDGIKDVVRTFNNKGEALREEADTNFDGRVDVWISFVQGRIAEENLDTNGDGRPDVWKAYTNGVLARIKRDRNGDGKPDVWEIYTRGRLERMGVDESMDGHVDRWDRDQLQLAEAEEAEKKAKEQMAAADAGPR